LLSFFSSCEKKGKYTYIEVVKDEGILGDVTIKDENIELIQADDDSTAYLHAFQKFCISLKANRDMQTSAGKVYKTPLRFKLANAKGEDITYSVMLVDKLKSENDIMNRIFSVNNTSQRIK
jgi:hypothetical protein